ncbi:hypothetical protein [Metaclostridioides mangenotii]|uniref:hypothetical protein n=1 Tax=Metaclostridioides mangenotii TaxID=1540 RepID=UPI000464CC73|nr:hypothetical protein [Clostridioides mangenotii]
MNVKVINEVKKGFDDSEWTLCFQYCTYPYEEADDQNGYRFIWRDPKNHLQPVMGQTRIPSVKDAKELIDMAIEEGWGEFEHPFEYVKE